MEIIWILAGLFIFVTIVFIALAVFFPEWVGITGKVARKHMSEQSGDEPESKD
jgi:uncharacterized membrane protein (DUF485 family)